MSSYVSQADVSAPGGASMLEQHKVFMTAGHSEYWDAGARDNVTTARNAGVNLAFFAGNLMWWKTRWAASAITGENYRTLITYKESLDSAQTDPDDPPTWTGSWRDPRFSPPGDGGQPENALTGQLWMVDCCSVRRHGAGCLLEASDLGKHGGGETAAQHYVHNAERDSRPGVGLGR